MSALGNAQAAWGESLPDWVKVLAEFCDKTTQSEAAKQVGISGAAVSQVINLKYHKGDYGAVEKKVRGSLMSETVLCAVQGQITLDVCMGNQAAGGSTSSPQRLRLGRTCPVCVHRHHGGNHAE